MKLDFETPEFWIKILCNFLSEFMSDFFSANRCLLWTYCVLPPLTAQRKEMRFSVTQGIRDTVQKESSLGQKSQGWLQRFVLNNWITSDTIYSYSKCWPTGHPISGTYYYTMYRVLSSLDDCICCFLHLEDTLLPCVPYKFQLVQAATLMSHPLWELRFSPHSSFLSTWRAHSAARNIFPTSLISQGFALKTHTFTSLLTM